MISLFKTIKLYFTDRLYYEQRKRYKAKQKIVRKKLKKLSSKFCPWDGCYIHNMIKVMIDFYYETYLSGDCCFSEESWIKEISASLGNTKYWADQLDLIDSLENDAILSLANSDQKFEEYLAYWSESNHLPVTDKNRHYLAYSFLEKTYTERFYSNIGKHIWEWCD